MDSFDFADDLYVKNRVLYHSMFRICAAIVDGLHRSCSMCHSFYNLMVPTTLSHFTGYDNADVRKLQDPKKSFLSLKLTGVNTNFRVSWLNLSPNQCNKFSFSPVSRKIFYEFSAMIQEQQSSPKAVNVGSIIVNILEDYIGQLRRHNRDNRMSQMIKFYPITPGELNTSKHELQDFHGEDFYHEMVTALKRWGVKTDNNPHPEYVLSTDEKKKQYMKLYIDDGSSPHGYNARRTKVFRDDIIKKLINSDNKELQKEIDNNYDFDRKKTNECKLYLAQANCGLIYQSARNNKLNIF